MNTLAALWLAVAAGSAALNWFAVFRGVPRLEWVAKPATLAFLIGAAVALDPARSSVRAWFVVALACSLAGDVFLMLPEERFVAGLVAFFAGHLAYVAGLALTFDPGPGLVVGVAAVAIAVPTVGRVVLGAVRRRDPDLAGPVAAYLVVISLMVLAAGGSGVAFAIGGAVLFYVSDATLAWNRFVRPLRYGGLATMVTYHLGQAGLVLGLLDLR